MPFKKGDANNKGRPVGSKSKVSAEFRVTIDNLLKDNADNIAYWLKLVAEGRPKRGKDNVVRYFGADPAKALDLIAKLAEFAAPKLSRAEITGAPANSSMNVFVLSDEQLLQIAQGQTPAIEHEDSP